MPNRKIRNDKKHEKRRRKPRRFTRHEVNRILRENPDTWGMVLFGEVLKRAIKTVE